MTFIALASLIAMVAAVVKSKKKLRTLLFILGWTLAASTVAGTVTFLFATMTRAGNPPAMAGDITGPTLTLTLLISSIKRLRDGAKPPDEVDRIGVPGASRGSAGIRRRAWEDIER